MSLNWLLIVFFGFAFSPAFSKNQTLVLEWKFNGIEEGYDHLNRNRIFVDGVEMPVSNEFLQSNWGSYPLKLAKKTYRIKVINEAYYNGKWLEHTFENEFSMNAVCEFTVNVKEVSKIRIQFNLNGASVSVVQFDHNGNEWNEKREAFKGKHYPLTLDWKFISVEEGYDHLSRMVVYVDGIETGVSPESIESRGGSCTIMIPRGEHRVRIMNQSFVNGAWQDHTIINNYSIDAVYEKELTVKRGIRVTLVIDLNDQKTVNTWE